VIYQIPSGEIRVTHNTSILKFSITPSFIPGRIRERAILTLMEVLPMRLNTIDEAAWRTFRKQFPQAYSFLLEESLKGEYRELRSRGDLNEWEIERLNELQILRKQWLDIMDNS